MDRNHSFLNKAYIVRHLQKCVEISLTCHTALIRLIIIMFHSGVAESHVTPSGKIMYTGPVFGLISNGFEHFHIGPGLLDIPMKKNKNGLMHDLHQSKCTCTGSSTNTLSI